MSTAKDTSLRHLFSFARPASALGSDEPTPLFPLLSSTQEPNEKADFSLQLVAAEKQDENRQQTQATERAADPQPPKPETEDARAQVRSTRADERKRKRGKKAAAGRSDTYGDAVPENSVLPHSTSHVLPKRRIVDEALVYAQAHSFVASNDVQWDLEGEHAWDEWRATWKRDLKQRRKEKLRGRRIGDAVKSK
ncbi:hypothetical protein FVE85_3260 [Porphyridium purpureum]|uniref:Uncharacterized protein n=1 Tax=Porphyridium purpureum TaxID=35688 RepID=A0A5J4YU35_PORPP|nr:hypothetical protein FVE85_3260 [Porphyridium purpureum]|eukprot:POR8612..scf227_4